MRFLTILALLCTSTFAGDLTPAPSDLPHEDNWFLDDICGDRHGWLDAQLAHGFIQIQGEKLAAKHAELQTMLDSTIAFRLEMLDLEIGLLDNCQVVCVVGSNKDYWREKADEHENNYCALLADSNRFLVRDIYSRLNDIERSFNNRPHREDPEFCLWWSGWAESIMSLKQDVADATRAVGSAHLNAKILLTQINADIDYLKNHSCLPTIDIVW